MRKDEARRIALRQTAGAVEEALRLEGYVWDGTAMPSAAWHK